MRHQRCAGRTVDETENVAPRGHRDIRHASCRCAGLSEQPVTFITPAAAGNSPDVLTRLFADRLTQIWKQQIVVMNRPGAGGMLAAQAAANVANDGYTLYMTQASTYTVLPVEQEGKMTVDLQRAFVPIGMVGEQPIAVAVNKDIPANSVAELIALANKTQGGMLFGATNRGGQAHLTGELFRERSKANISFVHARRRGLTERCCGGPYPHHV